MCEERVGYIKVFPGVSLRLIIRLDSHRPAFFLHMPSYKHTSTFTFTHRITNIRRLACNDRYNDGYNDRYNRTFAQLCICN